MHDLHTIDKVTCSAKEFVFMDVDRALITDTVVDLKHKILCHGQPHTKKGV